VKNTKLQNTEKSSLKYYDDTNYKESKKSTNVNILLNRVKSNQKLESRKKLYFSAITSTGLILFGIFVFY
tara:strand:- start:458 stop:667 length:210 start_codon:yes stop_codon:yes gene_type:complete